MKRQNSLQGQLSYSKQPRKQLEEGGRNLVILGVVSVLIAAMTTGVALAIYHNSGDIYLDRSRPGFLPDEDELEDESEKEEEEEYSFAKDGKLTRKDVEDFLDNLNKEIDSIDAYKKPFGSDVLSDEYLGITNKTGQIEATTEGELTE